jgi:Flp pilus assembly protein TadG
VSAIRPAVHRGGWAGHRAAGARASPREAREKGQAAIELALAFPIVMVLLLALVQVTLVVRDQVAVIHAAREGARAAAATGATAGDGAAAAREATALGSARLSVDVVTGAEVRATVRYQSPTDVPLVGRLLGDVTVQATAVMRAEP